MKSACVLFLFVIFSSEAFAQNSSRCIRLENLEIGCVPSVDHSCYMNKAVDKVSSCKYVGSPGTSIRAEGPIAWNCASSTNTRTCTQVCNDDSCEERCVTRSVCTVYQSPVCQETCVQCFNQVVVANVGINRGCIVCTRALCADEYPRQARTVCPPVYNGMPKANGETCAASTRCPTTAIDPNGVSHTVTVNGPGNCQPQPLPEPPPELPEPLLCPWKVDERTGGRPPRANGPTDPGDPGNCEPIRPANSNL